MSHSPAGLARHQRVPEGVIEGCLAFPDRIGTLYAAWHGVEGVLLEELVDVSASRARRSSSFPRHPRPASSGTCRYKLAEGQEEDFERIVEVIRAHDIGYFFYIGGNDSMDTAAKVPRSRSDGAWSWW